MTRIQFLHLIAIALTGAIPMSISAAPVQDNGLILREGEPVSLRVTKPLSSKTAHPGDLVDLELAKDLRVNNEFYVAPAYNELLAVGQQLRVCNIGREAAGSRAGRFWKLVGGQRLPKSLFHQCAGDSAHSRHDKSRGVGTRRSRLVVRKQLQCGRQATCPRHP